MTSPTWPEIVARLRDTVARCSRDTDLELSAGSRRIRLLVRRDVVRVVCPGYDEARLAALGWHRPTGDGDWWYEGPRAAEHLKPLSVFVARTAAEVLTDRPGALSCRPVRPAAGPTPAARSAPQATALPATAPAPAEAEPAVVALLAAAADRRDLSGYLGVLAGATVCVPLAGEPAADADFPWTVVGDATGATLLPVFTSPGPSPRSPGTACRSSHCPAPSCSKIGRTRRGGWRSTRAGPGRSPWPRRRWRPCSRRTPRPASARRSEEHAAAPRVARTTHGSGVGHPAGGGEGPLGWAAWMAWTTNTRRCGCRRTSTG